MKLHLLSFDRIKQSNEKYLQEFQIVQDFLVCLFDHVVPDHNTIMH